MVAGGLFAATAGAQIQPFGVAQGPAATHPPGLQDGWLKTFGSSEGLGDFATEGSAAGYGLVAVGGEYRGTLLDQAAATVAPTSASSGQTFFPAGFVAAAAEDGTGFWSRGMIGVATGGLRGSARTNAVAFGFPGVLPTATLFAAGSYQNKVEFDTVGAGLQKTAVGTSTSDCFVASFDVDGDALNWVRTFPSVTSTANDEIFGADSSLKFDFTGGDNFEGVNWDLTQDPPTGTPPAGKDSLGEGPFSLVAVCGGFNGTIDFDESDPGGARETSAGDEDGFVVLLDQTTGDYLGHATFGGTGADRAFAVVVGPDPEFPPALGGDLMPPMTYVCGYFSGTVTFGALEAVSSAGGRDGFVARLRMSPLGASGIGLTWDRLYTFGSVDNDVARALSHEDIIRKTPSLDNDFGRIAFTGWTGGGSAEARELITGVLIDYEFPELIVGLDEDDFEVDWQHELTNNDDTDDAGLGVAWNKLSGVVVTGQYGVEKLPSGSSIAASASFDPAGGDDKTTQGGWDGFVARYSTGGAYLDAASYGWGFNDWATSIVVDRATEQVWISGVFGHSNAPTSYNVGFGTSLRGWSRGAADVFWLSLERDLPESLDAMVSIVLDSSGSMADEWEDVKASLARIFREEPFTVRQTGRLAFNVVLFGGDQNAVEAVPWTIIDAASAEGFAAAIEDMQRLGGGTNVWDGVDFALTAFEASPLLPLTDVDDRLMLVTGDGTDGDPPAALVTRVQTLGWPAEVAGVPIGSESVRDWYEDEVITLSQATSPKLILHFAEATSDPLDPTHFEYQARKALKELTCCRGDFNGDGQHDSSDFLDFQTLFGQTHPATDLDCDGFWTTADFDLFQAYQLEECPCGL